MPKLNTEWSHLISTLCLEDYLHEKGLDPLTLMNKAYQPFLELKPCSALPGQRGLYLTGTKISKGALLGIYAGELKPKPPKPCKKTNDLYRFRLDNEHIIDAAGNANLTAFCNHTDNQYNCRFKVVEGPGKLRIPVVQTTVDIDARSGPVGLLLNYGKGYFRSRKIQPYFLNPLINWKTPEILVAESEAYLPTPHRFKSLMCEKAFLPSNAYRITPLMEAVIHENPEQLESLLTQKNHDPDLPALALATTDTFMPMFLQPYLTPLMVACFLGNQTLIKRLLEGGTSPNLEHLQLGYNALDFVFNSPMIDSRDKIRLCALFRQSKLKWRTNKVINPLPLEAAETLA